MISTLPVVKLKGISKNFPGVQALNQVSFDIYPGEILAIVGENGAGKSTLMNILSGVYQPDEGEIIYLGEKIEISNPYISQKLGISVVYQELSLCPNLSVAENISLLTLSEQSNLTFVNKNEVLENAKEVLSQLGLENFNLAVHVGDLSVAKQQLVEIAKAISINVRLLILDEPNSALSEEDNEHLFKVINDLKEKGVSIIYVSHRLEEVINLADRIIVLRDGNLIQSLDANTATVDKLIEKVAGRAMDNLYQHVAEDNTSDSIVFEVRGLSYEDKVQDISLKVHKGEIFGIAGLPDSGKDEFVECLFGLRKYSGDILLNGKVVEIKSPTDAINNGLALVPANRREAGAILSMNVKDNIVSSDLKSLNKFGFLDYKNIQTVSKNFVQKFSIKVSSLAQVMRTISGGNQQKIILSRGLATNPMLLLLHEPTRGIDVGAKAEIYKILREISKSGATIIIVSSELTELMAQCNTILVMYNGKKQGVFDQSETEEKQIVACLMGEATNL
ncbi:MAG: sugar ABC transporter ATP-binding protein [Anaerolineaceae bacterium]|nr:sugar ABC transporter ATP-binding protein [Anaerolineaceae bacterium]